MIAAVSAAACPRCKRTSTTPLAREGDLQRYQCLSCSENFTAPFVEEKSPENGGETPSLARFAHVPIAPADPSDDPLSGDGAAGHCPKCKKPYYRLGKRYEIHVAACDGTPYVESRPRTKASDAAPTAPAAAVPQVSAAPVAAASIPAAAQKAFDLSIEALKAQRSVLEAEIQGINGAIATIEKLKGLGGAPSAPFADGA